MTHRSPVIRIKRIEHHETQIGPAFVSIIGQYTSSKPKDPQLIAHLMQHCKEYLFVGHRNPEPAAWPSWSGYKGDPYTADPALIDEALVKSIDLTPYRFGWIRRNTLIQWACVRTFLGMRTLKGGPNPYALMEYTVNRDRAIINYCNQVAFLPDTVLDRSTRLPSQATHPHGWYQSMITTIAFLITMIHAWRYPAIKYNIPGRNTIPYTPWLHIKPYIHPPIHSIRAKGAEAYRQVRIHLQSAKTTWNRWKNRPDTLHTATHYTIALAGKPNVRRTGTLEDAVTFSQKPGVMKTYPWHATVVFYHEDTPLSTFPIGYLRGIGPYCWCRMGRKRLIPPSA